MLMYFLKCQKKEQSGLSSHPWSSESRMLHKTVMDSTCLATVTDWYRTWVPNYLKDEGGPK